MIHPLDRFFKKKLEQSPHEMEEAHWLQALELLEAQDDQRRRKGIPIWFWVILPFAIGALIWTLVAQPDKPGVAVAVSETTQPGTEKPPAESALNGTKEALLNRKIQGDESQDVENTKRLTNRSNQNLIEKGGVEAIRKSSFSKKGGNKIMNLPTIAGGLMVIENTAIASSPVEEENQSNEMLNKTNVSTASFSNLPVYSTDLLPMTKIKPLTQEKYHDFVIPPVELITEVQTTSPKYPLLLGIGASARLFPFQSAGQTPMSGYQGDLFFSSKINDQWSWNLDLQYALLKGDLPYTKENQVVQYSFGRQTFDRRLQPLSLHYGAALLSVHRTFDRQALGIGIGYNRLIGVRGMLTHSGAFTAEVDTSSYNVPMWIKKDGFNRWNIPVQLSWSYQVNHRLSAQVTAGYFFRDILDNNHSYPVSTTTSPLQSFNLEAGIRYSLFELKSVTK